MNKSISLCSEMGTTGRSEAVFEYRHADRLYVKILREGKYVFYRDGTEIDIEEWNRDANKYQAMLHKEEHPLFLVRLAEAHRRRTLLRLANPSSSHVVVEVGCEAGSLSRSLAPLCGKLVCVDVDENMLERARKRVASPNVSFLCSSVEALDLNNNAADITVCAEVLEHVLYPQLAAKELVRITKPGGKIVVSVPNERFILFLKKALVKSGFSRLLGNLNMTLAMGHLHIFTPRLLEELFTKESARVTAFRSRPFYFNLFALVQPKEE